MTVEDIDREMALGCKYAVMAEFYVENELGHETIGYDTLFFEIGNPRGRNPYYNETVQYLHIADNVLYIHVYVRKENET